MSFDYGYTTTYLVATLFLVACDLDIYSGEPHLEKVWCIRVQKRHVTPRSNLPKTTSQNTVFKCFRGPCSLQTATSTRRQSDRLVNRYLNFGTKFPL